MKLFEREQHTILPTFIQQCIRAANDEDEDEDPGDGGGASSDDDDEGSSLPESSANPPSVLKVAGRSTVLAPNQSIRLRHTRAGGSIRGVVSARHGQRSRCHRCRPMRSSSGATSGIGGGCTVRQASWFTC